ncbi:AbrB/MazE/SpoVT family DNA-binding domain-containing protein [Halosimplex amylolyticum]|uniref:AbrB/MazE/SpoVT family DNA-binding domain-containing protein n=1 Tax=Halosimplex amylolyticum TaxID=3396616 RepID=UPI003F56465F
MKTRKLQQVGGGTYTVSIPKDWANEHRLEAGMELYLSTHIDDSIVLRTAEKDVDELGSATVVVDGEEPALVRRALRAAHAVGFETVTLEPADAFTDEQRRVAREVVRTLVGSDLLVESADEITVQHLLDAANVSVRQSVVQLQYTALSIHRTATDALVDADAEAHERLQARADEADRLSRMVARHVSRSLVSLEEVDRLGLTRPTLFDYYVTARRLEEVSRHGVGVARAAERLPEPLPGPVAENVRDAAAAARGVVDDATTAVLDEGDDVRETGAAARYDDAVTDIEAVEEALFDEATAPFDRSTAATVALARALDHLARTADAGAAVADVATRAAIRSKNV